MARTGTGNVYAPKYVISHRLLLHKEFLVIIGEEYTISCPSFMVGGFGYQCEQHKFTVSIPKSETRRVQ